MTTASAGDIVAIAAIVAATAGVTPSIVAASDGDNAVNAAGPTSLAFCAIVSASLLSIESSKAVIAGSIADCGGVSSNVWMFQGMALKLTLSSLKLVISSE